MMPIEDAHVRNEIVLIIETLLADISEARELQAGRNRQRVVPKKSERGRERARRLARAH